MLRNRISIFFSLVFLVFLATPSVIVMLDNTIDVSVFYASSEEEEKGHEKNKNLEILFSKNIDSDFVFHSKTTINNLGYYFKKYTKPHLNIISPPPERRM